MRTHIVLNDDLITEAMQLAKVKTKREAVDIALRRFVASHKQRRILELVGQELISPDYDYKAARMGDELQSDSLCYRSLDTLIGSKP